MTSSRDGDESEEARAEREACRDEARRRADAVRSALERYAKALDARLVDETMATALEEAERALREAVGALAELRATPASEPIPSTLRSLSVAQPSAPEAAPPPARSKPAPPSAKAAAGEAAPDSTEADLRSTKR